MNGVISIAGVIAMLLVFGGLLATMRRHLFAPKWLVVAAGLVVLMDFMLTRAYGLAPHLLPPFEWNWQGKIMALATTLAIASLPTFGWQRSGLTVKQAKGSLASTVPFVIIYGLFFIALAISFRARLRLARPWHSN